VRLGSASPWRLGTCGAFTLGFAFVFKPAVFTVAQPLGCASPATFRLPENDVANLVCDLKVVLPAQPKGYATGTA